MPTRAWALPPSWSRRSAPPSTIPMKRMLERRRALIRSSIVGAVALPLFVFVLRELAARPSETDVRLLAARTALSATRVAVHAEAKSNAGDNAKAAAEYKRAATAFDQAATLLEEFRARWFWTLASRSTARELEEWRRLAARARISAADAYHRASLDDEAYVLLRKVSRSPATPAAEAKEAEEGLQLLKGLVSDTVEESVR